MSKFKIGDKLVCLDVEAYLDIDNKWVSSRRKIVESSLIVDHIYENGALGLEGIDYCIPVKDFEYFKKKGRYTFDDLIDVANDAVKNKLITQTRFSLSTIDTPLLIVVYFDGREGRYTYDNFINGINFIQSLYKETFVIESEEDIKKIKNDCDKITLSNGEILPKKTYRKLKDSHHEFIVFRLIKGATVEQERTQ